MSNSHVTSQPVAVAPWRDRLSQRLMLVLALAASFAFAAASRAVAAALPETRALEIWRMLSDLAFSAIFILLALRPRSHPGLWEVALFHYAGAALFLGAMAPSVATDVLVADAVIALAVATGYGLTKGYLAWNLGEMRMGAVPSIFAASPPGDGNAAGGA